MPKVRVSMFEDPIDVPEEEVPVLRAQGLLVEDDEPGDDGAAKPAAGTPAKPAPSGAGQEGTP